MCIYDAADFGAAIRQHRTVWRKPHSGARRRGGWGFLYVFRLYSFASLRFRTSTAIMPMLTAHRPA